MTANNLNYTECESIFSKIRNETGCPFLSSLNQYNKFLVRKIKQEKEIRGIQIGKQEVRLFLFARQYDSILIRP
jgi:hypothetical protein